MNGLRRAILAFVLMAGLAPAFAAAPPAVPPLPDAPRQTTYTITNQTCSCAVNFALYGDGTDFNNWLEVWLNNKLVSYNDPTFGWTITSPSGSLGQHSIPITDAVLTFNSPQTGTVQIIGARRPRRVSQFSEQRGVAARDLNVAITDLVAQNRENWDKTNDLTGRGFFFAPGTTVGPMPTPAQCANAFFGFDGTGENPLCAQIIGSGSLATPGSTTNGDIATWNGTDGKHLGDSGVALSVLPTLAGTNAFTGANTFSGNNAFAGTSTFSGDNYFGGRPWFDVLAVAHGCAAADPTGAADSTTAIQCHINYMHTTFGGGVVNVPCGTYLVSGGGVLVTQGVWLIGGGQLCTTIKVSTDSIAVQFAISTTTNNSCPSGGHYGGMENLSVLGYTNSSSGAPATKIWDDCNVTIRDVRSWYGAQGLVNRGVDSHVITSFICGYTSCVYSQGANWYVRDKLDNVGVTMVAGAAAFQQGPNISGLALAENHFSQTDMSCSCSYSYYADDAANADITDISGGVLDSPIFINHMKMVFMRGNEIGSTTWTQNAGSMIANGNYGFSPLTVTGAGARVCTGNINITC